MMFCSEHEKPQTIYIYIIVYMYIYIYTNIACEKHQTNWWAIAKLWNLSRQHSAAHIWMYDGRSIAKLIQCIPWISMFIYIYIHTYIYTLKDYMCNTNMFVSIYIDIHVHSIDIFWNITTFYKVYIDIYKFI